MDRHRRLANHSGVQHLCHLRPVASHPNYSVGPSGDFQCDRFGPQPELSVAARRRGRGERHTNANFTIPSTVTGQDGSYSVIVSNSFSSVTSTVASLVILYAEESSLGRWWVHVGHHSPTGPPITAVPPSLTRIRITCSSIPWASRKPNITVSSELAPGSIVVSNGTYMLSGADLTALVH